MSPLYWIVVALGLSLVVLSVTVWLVYHDLLRRINTVGPAEQAEFDKLKGIVDQERKDLRAVYRALKGQLNEQQALVTQLQQQLANGQDPGETIAAIQALEVSVAGLSDDEAAEDAAPDTATTDSGATAPTA